MLAEGVSTLYREVPKDTYKDYDGRSERKEFVEGTNVSSLLDTSNTSENEVSRILIWILPFFEDLYLLSVMDIYTERIRRLLYYFE